MKHKTLVTLLRLQGKTLVTTTETLETERIGVLTQTEEEQYFKILFWCAHIVFFFKQAVSP